MSDLTHLFTIGQRVIYRNNDFDAIKRDIPCIVKETYPDHIIITDVETNTDLWIQEELNLAYVYPDYNCLKKQNAITMEIDETWSNYDKKVAETHLLMYGRIYLDEYGKPIDNEYELEEIASEYTER